MSNNDDKPTHVQDSAADTMPDGDGVSVDVPMPDDRGDMVRAVVFGNRFMRKMTAGDREFANLTREQELRTAVREGRVAKAAEPVGSTEVEHQQSIPSGQEEQRPWTSSGALAPPYDPAVMGHLFEHSNSLRQNVDAYVTNVESFGYHLKATLNLESDDIEDQVRVALVQDALLAGELEPAEPTASVVKAKLKEIKRAIEAERVRLDFFFKNAVMDESFVTLRMKTRQDLEITGNSYWEVLRDREGKLSQFILVPAHTVRLLPLGKALVQVEQLVQASPITFTKRIFRRRFRTYVQSIEGAKVYFKELGDARLVSAKTGRVWSSEAAMREEEGEDAMAANELIHFVIHSSRSPYGVPRWIGALLSVIGSRQAEEVNFLYFDNKGVPPMVLMVTGGRVSESTVERIRDYIESDIKGRANFHNILVLEAEPTTGQGPEHTGKMRIELKPLTSAQHNDALFLKYDQENINKVGQAFRIPPLLRGDSRDFNRATAQAVLKFTETQVFAPERNRFDDVINRRILTDLGACYHKFESNSPKTTDPEDQAKVIERLARIGALVPRDVRALSEEILNTELKRIDEPWMDIPIPLATSGRIAELVAGDGDLFDPGSGVSQQTPLGPGSGDDAADDGGDAAAQKLLRTLAKDGAAVGTLQPGQAQRLVRTPTVQRALKLLRTRAILKAAEQAALDAEREQAAEEIAAAKDDLEPEVFVVPRETWDGFGIIPDKK